MSQMISLKTATTFRRNGPNGVQVLVLQPGERVKYVRTETETTVVHTATALRDGFVWTSVKTSPKNGAARTDRAAEATQRAALAAVSRQAAKEVEGVDDLERGVDHRRKMIDALEGDLWRVNYYIPTALEGEGEHPSKVFHRHAVSLDGSNWVFTDRELKHPEVQVLIREWEKVQPVRVRTAAGYVRTVAVEFWVEKYHPEEVEKALQRARNALHNHLIDVHTSLIERIAGASDRLREAQEKLPPEATEQERKRPQEAHYSALRGALRDATEAFRAALLAAEAFDERENLSDLFEGVRAAIRAEALAANAILRDAGRKPIALPDGVA